jgi:hypothetical protein
MTDFWLPSRKGGFEFEKAFYDLGLDAKYRIIAPHLDTFDEITLIRLTNAILQHSSPEAKKRYPVQGIRKLSRAARLADLGE